MIAAMPDSVPKVEMRSGGVGIVALDGGEQHGFLFSREVAIDVAIRLLATVDRMPGGTPHLPLSDLELDKALSHDTTLFDHGARLTLVHDGAKLSFILDATQVAELAAAAVQLSHDLDKPEG